MTRNRRPSSGNVLDQIRHHFLYLRGNTGIHFRVPIREQSGLRVVFFLCEIRVVEM